MRHMRRGAGTASGMRWGHGAVRAPRPGALHRRSHDAPSEATASAAAAVQGAIHPYTCDLAQPPGMQRACTEAALPQLGPQAARLLSACMHARLRLRLRHARIHNSLLPLLSILRNFSMAWYTCAHKEGGARVSCSAGSAGCGRRGCTLEAPDAACYLCTWQTWHCCLPPHASAEPGCRHGHRWAAATLSQHKFKTEAALACVAVKAEQAPSPPCSRPRCSRSGWNPYPGSRT